MPPECPNSHNNLSELSTILGGLIISQEQPMQLWKKSSSVLSLK
jgi:hypothetical protein